MFALRLYKQYATESRLNKITDSNGMVEIYFWNNSDITSDDVVLESDNELEGSASEKRALLLSLYDKGLLSNEKGEVTQSTKLKILDTLGFRNWDNFCDIREFHKVKANKENLRLTMLGDVMEIDDHDIHINEHIKFLISDESKNIKENFKKQLIDHINKHKTLNLKK